MEPTEIRVAALYCFTAFADVGAVATALARDCDRLALRGTLLLAPEGINGTIAGTPAAIDAMLAEIRALPGCAGLEVKLSGAAAMPFHRMKVRQKAEIVTMGAPGLDSGAVGAYVTPADWNALIDDLDTIVIDTRNGYEVAIGSFAGAINPGTMAFRDFPDWFRANRDALFAGRDAPRVAMFCTGGIRCEKATAFLKSEGIADVLHLQGGILKYLETVPETASRWQGECFVFDERVSLRHGLAPGSHSLCRGCRMPVSAADRASPLYVEGVACPACSASRDETQRAGYAERHRQATLAAAHGRVHIGQPVQRDDG
ncbi:rhodanese-related sulfurtransferase [Sandarakinorhabdus sp. DWP1-3-1]|uniref:oxygen-dependent tRNA uridine(34) hydroxylase TrhO n=1 Tax=Sandarakinorhabdus sp. DWP1-3-1 TaxID=2804627 RepID=UPI003CEC9195